MFTTAAPAPVVSPCLLTAGPTASRPVLARTRQPSPRFTAPLNDVNGWGTLPLWIRNEKPTRLLRRRRSHAALW